jgi:hypothetical protein
MNKPAFNDLPWSVQERLWRDLDDLDYDSYDSSREQCIADIRNGDISYYNQEGIKNLYARTELSDVQRLLTQHIESLKDSLAYSEQLLEKIKA